MDSIRKWTTPTQTFVIEGVDLTSADVYVTMAQGDVTTTFSGDDITVTYDGDNTTVALPLTQAITGGFSTDSTIAVQVNWMSEGQRNATTIEYIKVQKNLYDETI